MTSEERWFYLRWSSHFLRDDCVSPDRFPARRASTLMSSSRSGQWIPSWSPMKGHLSLSVDEAWRRRGHHARGTAIVRPSTRSTVRASSVIVTVCALASRTSIAEELIPISLNMHVRWLVPVPGIDEETVGTRTQKGRRRWSLQQSMAGGGWRICPSGSAISAAQRPRAKME